MTENSPTYVSFVVSTFQRTDAVRRTLEHLAALTYPHDCLEVIIVDDGDQRETERVVREVDLRGTLVTYLPQSGSGVARARNAGAERARGEVLIFLDDDILVEPDHVQRHLSARERYGDCLVNGHWEFEPALRKALAETPFGRFRLDVEDLVKTGIRKVELGDGRLEPDGITACNLSISVQRFRELGGFDETFPFAGCEDQEFSYRAARSGCRFVYDPTIRLLHNDHRVTLQQFSDRQRRGALTSVYLVARHPDAFAARPLLLENAPISRLDPPRMWAKKLTKRIFSTRPVLAAAARLSRVLEARRPNSRLLKRLYEMTIGAHIFLGIRDGVARLPEARAAAELARRRHAAA